MTDHECGSTSGSHGYPSCVWKYGCYIERSSSSDRSYTSWFQPSAKEALLWGRAIHYLPEKILDIHLRGSVTKACLLYFPAHRLRGRGAIYIHLSFFLSFYFSTPSQVLTHSPNISHRSRSIDMNRSYELDMSPNVSSH